MSEIKDWSQVDANNTDASPDGWPEGMARSGVNNSAREGMAVLRRFYENPEWIDLLTEDDDNYTVARGSATEVIATSDGTSSAILKYPDKTRVRLTESGGGFQYGFIDGIPSFGSPDTTFVIDVDGGADVHVNTNKLEGAIMKDLVGRAGYSPIGVTLAQDPPEIPSIDDLGTAALLDNGDINAATLEGSDLAAVIAAAEVGNRNLTMNSQFKIWQRGLTIDDTTTYPNDDNGYVCDRWRLLSGIGAGDIDNIVDVALDTTDVPLGFWSALKMTATADIAADPDPERAGVFQVMEGSDSVVLMNSTVSLSFYCKVVGIVTNVRAMLLKWTGAEDMTTADPIADWQSAGDGTGPTPSGSWEKVMDTGQLTASATWTQYTANVQGIDLSGHTNAKNFGLLLYVDSTDFALNDTVSFSGVQLEIASSSTDYQGTTFAEELARCQRYYNKTFDYLEAPADDTTLDGTIMAYTNTLGNMTLTWTYPQMMRVTPTIVTYNPLNATVGNVTRLPSSDIAWAPSQTQTGTRCLIYITGGGFNFAWALHADASAEL
jgi:hypothetical protein